MALINKQSELTAIHEYCMEILPGDDLRYQTETHQLRVTLSTPLGFRNEGHGSL
jgi:hypothetical protein